MRAKNISTYSCYHFPLMFLRLSSFKISDMMALMTAIYLRLLAPALAVFAIQIVQGMPTATPISAPVPLEIAVRRLGRGGHVMDAEPSMPMIQTQTRIVPGGGTMTGASAVRTCPVNGASVARTFWLG